MISSGVNGDLKGGARKVKSLPTSPPKMNIFVLSECLSLISSSVINPLSCPQTPKCWTGRFLMNLWAIFCLLVLSSYTANLAAVMVGEKTFEQVSGIHDDKVRPKSGRAPTRRMCMQSNLTHGRVNEQREESFARDYQIPDPPPPRGVRGEDA